MIIPMRNMIKYVKWLKDLFECKPKGPPSHAFYFVLIHAIFNFRTTAMKTIYCLMGNHLANHTQLVKAIDVGENV